MFAVAKPGSHHTGGGSRPGVSPHAPSITLPLRFVLTGFLALFTGVVLLVMRPELLATYHYNQFVIAVTHLFVLGWIGTIVMGAMYQLVPVALETRLYSEKLGAAQFVLHVVGAAGMVWMFWKWDMKHVGHFGSLLGLGVGVFAYNIARTLLRVPRWNVIATAVASALGWLCLTVLAGLSIAAGKCSYEATSTVASGGPVGALVQAVESLALFVRRFDQMSAMHAHAHLGGVGVFLMLIVGVSYKLIPMFTLSELQSPRRATASVALLNVGLLGAFFTILFRSPLKFAFAAVVVAGIALYGVEILAILRARKRRTLDWGVKYFLSALSLLAPLSIAGLMLAWPGLPLTVFTGQLENVYGFLALIGVISFAIIGMLYKIVPFLVWYWSYSKQIGLSKVPSLADLYSPALQHLGYWLYAAGLVCTSVGILLSSTFGVRCGCLVIAGSLAVLALNMAKILSHLVRPRSEPLSFSKPAIQPIL